MLHGVPSVLEVEGLEEFALGSEEGEDGGLGDENGSDTVLRLEGTDVQTKVVKTLEPNEHAVPQEPNQLEVGCFETQG